jgi:hypothetical protein
VLPETFCDGAQFCYRFFLNLLYGLDKMSFQSGFNFGKKEKVCWGQWRSQEIFSVGGGGGSTNSVEDREQIERGSGDGSPLVRGPAQFGNG